MLNAVADAPGVTFRAAPIRRHGIDTPVIGTCYGLTFDLEIGILMSNVNPKRRARPNRPPPGHAGPVDPSHAAVRLRARPGNRARHPATIRRHAPRRPWFALPGA